MMNQNGGSQIDLFDRGVVAHIGLVRHIGVATLSGRYDLDDFFGGGSNRAPRKTDPAVRADVAGKSIAE